MNINRLNRAVACAIVVGGAILFAAPAHAEENTEPVLTDETSASVDPCSQESPQPECSTDTPPAEETEPILVVLDVEPEFVDPCGTESDGVIVPASTEQYTFYMEVDGENAGPLAEGFNLYTGVVQATPNPGYSLSPTTYTRWTYDFPNSAPCAPTVVNVAYECVDPDTRLGRFTATIDPGSQQISRWSIHIDNLWVGAADGTQTLVIDTKYLSAGTYDWIAGIDLFPDKGANAEGTVEVTSECMVAVGEPPVPPTTPTTPVEEPEIKALETSGHCRTFTVTNVGTVPTSDGMTGVALIMDNQPPGIIGLEPGQSHSYELAVGQTASLGFSDGEVWTVDGSLKFTAESCVVEFDLGDDVVEQYVEPVTVDPASVMLPATGYKSAEISLIAAGVLGLGAALSLAARRRPVM